MTLFCVDSFCATAEHTSEKRIGEIRARAEQGFAHEQVELAFAYLTGDGVAQDLGQAAHWYEEAARRGNPEAENQIGYFYQKGIGVRVDETRAVHWYQLAAASGLVWAKMNLGVSYLNGIGVRKNASTAQQLLEEAAAKGTGLAAAYLGVMQYYGVGVSVDKAAGEKWFVSGEKMHDPVSAFNLAYLYSVDADHAHDLPRALELLRFAASNGYVPAHHLLGQLLLNHPELPQMPGEMRTELENASSAWNWKATAMLGIMARDGKGMAADPAQALYYFKVSTIQGGAVAQGVLGGDLQALTSELSKAQQSRVTAQVESWTREHPKPKMFLSQTDETNRHFSHHGD